MLPSRAARGARGLVLVVLVLPLLSGCGGADRDGPTGASGDAVRVSAADKACRARWSALGATAEQRSQTGVDLRDAFASRWDSVRGGIDYYAETATAKDCGDLLAARRTTIDQVTAVVTRGLAYDAGRRRATAVALRASTAASPRTTKEPARVTRAYTILRKQTPGASKDLAPAYAELARAEPSDTSAVAQGVADLKLLARASDAYRASSAALTTIDAWHERLAKQRK